MITLTCAEQHPENMTPSNVLHFILLNAADVQKKRPGSDTVLMSHSSHSDAEARRSDAGPHAGQFEGGKERGREGGSRIYGRIMARLKGARVVTC